MAAQQQEYYSFNEYMEREPPWSANDKIDGGTSSGSNTDGSTCSSGDTQGTVKHNIGTANEKCTCWLASHDA